MFLLCHCARLGVRRNRSDWAEAARARPTFMAGALDFDQIAQNMLELGLAISNPDQIIVEPALAELSKQADKTTLIAIARILLVRNPPFWLKLVVRAQQVFRQYIPQDDLEDLLWIDPDLDQFLLSVSWLSGERKNDDAFSARLGEAAELFVFAALKKSGLAPIHVAKFSDAYGYDIEYRAGHIGRIEVKAASRNTQGGFHISRNEFDKSKLHGKEWRLIQLTFTNHAFVDDQLDASHIESIHELTSGVLQELVPADTDAFRWTESAFITAPSDAWRPADIVLDTDFRCKGFRQK